MLTLALLILGAADPMLTDELKLTSLTRCNNTAINVATSCEFRALFGPSGTFYVTTRQYNTLSIYVLYTRSGGTGYTFQVESCMEGMETTDCTDSADWYVVDAQTATNNYTDIEPKVYRRTVSATDRSVFMIGTLYPRMRINNLVCTGGGCSANDKVTVTVMMHADTMGFLP